MAFTMNATSVYGFEAINAYHRVEGVRIVAKDEIKFQLRVYKTTNDISFDDKEFSAKYELDGDNPIKQAYLHLKTLPEFANAVDC